MNTSCENYFKRPIYTSDSQELLIFLIWSIFLVFCGIDLHSDSLSLRSKSFHANYFNSSETQIRLSQCEQKVTEILRMNFWVLIRWYFFFCRVPFVSGIAFQFNNIKHNFRFQHQKSHISFRFYGHTSFCVRLTNPIYWWALNERQQWAIIIIILKRRK